MQSPQTSNLAKPTLSLADQLAAVQEWWAGAGVDQLFGEEPQTWLGEAEIAVDQRPASPRQDPEKRKIENEPPPPQMGGDPTDWPQSLESWSKWWVTEASFDIGRKALRIAPRGKRDAALMVLVPMPEAEDSDILLSGAQGWMLKNLARAMGVEEAQLYLASALPCHMAAPDWAGLDAAGLGRIVRHHLALVRPERLLVLGQGILPLVKNDSAQDTAPGDETAIQGQPTPAQPLDIMASYAPELLLEHGQRRAKLWRRLINWTV